MAIPTPTLSVCTVTGTFLTLDGTPIRNLKVVFEADQKNGVVQSPVAKTTFPTFETFGVTNDNGVLESVRTEPNGDVTKITGVELVFPDSANLSQKGWNYTATFMEDEDNTSTRLSFKAAAGTVDLSSATEVTSPIYAPNLQDYLQAVADARAARDATQALYNQVKNTISQVIPPGVWTQCLQYSPNWPIESYQYSSTTSFRPLSVRKQGSLVVIDGNITSVAAMGNGRIARLPGSQFYPSGGIASVISFIDKTDNHIYSADIDNAGYIIPRHPEAFNASRRQLIFFGSWMAD